MKKILLSLLSSFAFTFLLPSAHALPVGLNPASPLSGFDLGGGKYATLIGVQNGFVVGDTITSADLFGAILAGSVEGFFYGPGNATSSLFGNISLYSPFVSDVVVAGSANPARIWDSLYAVHSGTVVFSNGRGGTTTMTTGGTRVARDPFTQVPDSGATVALFGFALAALVALRRRIA